MVRSKHSIHSSDFVRKSHIRILIPTLISSFAWLARNDAKYDDKKICANQIIHKIMSFIHLSHIAKPFERTFWQGDLKVDELWNISLPPVPVPKVSPMYWIKPPPQWVKVNSDGAFNHVNRKATSGGVIRDEDGRILKGFKTFLGFSSILYA